MEYLAHFHKFILYDADKNWLENLQERVFEFKSSDKEKFFSEMLLFLINRDRGKKT